MNTFDIQCGEWRIHYAVEGEGPPLILLHGGAPGTRGFDSFARNIPAFAKHFCTYAIDFPGWGKSSRNLLPSGAWINPIERAGDVVIAFMHALGIRQASVIGGSFGGGAALYAAKKSPEMFERLVLVAPAGGESDGPPAPGLVKLLTYYSGDGPTEAKLLDLLVHCVHEASQLPAIGKRFQATAEPDYANAFPLRIPVGGIGVVEPVCRDPKLASLTLPILFVWGRQDRMQPFDCLSSFRSLPNQQSLVLSPCGHWPYWEEAETFNTKVLNFLIEGRFEGPAEEQRR